MAEENSILKESIQKLAGTFNKDIISIIFCVVTAINEDEKTCDCTPITSDGVSEIPGVQLNAEQNDGLTLFPEIGSTVIVGLSVRNTAFILATSDLFKYLLTINLTQISVTDGLIQLNDGSYGGFTKTRELKTQLDKLNDQLQAVISSLTNWTPIPNDGGAALKTYFATQIFGKTEADFNDIENTIITHGE